MGWTLNTDDNLCRPDDVTLTCKSDGFKINFPMQALYWDSESMTETERETAVATIGTEFFLFYFRSKVKPFQYIDKYSNVAFVSNQ